MSLQSVGYYPTEQLIITFFKNTQFSSRPQNHKTCHRQDLLAWLLRCDTALTNRCVGAPFRVDYEAVQETVRYVHLVKREATGIN